MATTHAHIGISFSVLNLHGEIDLNLVIGPDLVWFLFFGKPDPIQLGLDLVDIYRIFRALC
jgi:hypothetical protein